MDKLQTTRKWFIFMVPLVIAMSSFVMGYFMVYLTMMEEYLQKIHQYSQEESEMYFTIATALLPVGAFAASFFYDKFVDVYGQNKVMRIMNVLGIIAISMQIISLNTVVLCVSRFLMGFYCGIISGVVPSYVLSLSPSFTSGIVGTYNQVAITLGMAFAYYLGQLLDDNYFSQTTAVNILIGFPIICISVHLVVLFMHPYDNIERHIQKRQNNKVRKYLKTVYGANLKAFQLEIQQYKVIPIEIDPSNKSTRDIYDQENFQTDSNKCKCTKLNFIILAIALAAANQLSGITAILQYAKQLFLTIEQGDESEADVSVMLLGFFQVLVTFTSGFLINRFGRRPMMLIGIAIFSIALITAFIVTQFLEQHEKITVILVFIHVLGYSISLGPICMLYAVQALQNINLVLIVNWGLYTVITLVSDYLIESVGLSFMFLTFGLFSVLSFWFFYVYMVQTRNTSRKKIRQNMEGIKVEWQKTLTTFSISNLKKKITKEAEDNGQVDENKEKEASPQKNAPAV